LEARAGRADSSTNDYAEQVCPAHSAVAAVGKKSTHFVRARDLVVYLGYRGINLKGCSHDLFGDALMQPEDLPPEHHWLQAFATDLLPMRPGSVQRCSPKLTVSTAWIR
jgi:hypothetical protein